LCFSIPISVVSNAEVGGGLQNAAHRADGRKDLAIELTQREAVVERVVDENRRLQHHREVGDGQIHHEHVGTRTKSLCPEYHNVKIKLVAKVMVCESTH
jgi:hypothetical protein